MTSRPPEDGSTCPRCGDRLSASSSVGLSCAGCGGSFVTRAALERLLADFAAAGEAATYRTPARADGPPKGAGGAYEPTFKYLSCPACGAVMNRQNFLKRSGVIVDVCLHHGTWFDADEARRAGAYVVAGGRDPEDEAAPSSAAQGAGQRLLDLLQKYAR